MIAEWVQAKRSAGVTPAAVLDPLGLQLTREATIRDEDSVWAMVALAVAEYRQRLIEGFEKEFSTLKREPRVRGRDA